jgi:FKBP-type peptidyl-prolyl cis-trans isomerase (trigger factor)
MKAKINKEEGSQVEIEVTIPWADFHKYWDKGFKKIQDMVEMPGFRKGMAPENMVIEKYGEMTVLEAMSDLAINETYPVVIMENKIKIISHPHIHVVKIAKGEDFVYHAHVDVMPELTLPDYKAIAKEVVKGKTEVTVTDEDMDKILTDLRKMRATKKETVNEETKEVTSEDVLPELNDEFAQSFGEEFATLEILKTKVRENTLLEKTQIEKEKLRSALLEKLVSETKGEMPKTLVEGEIDRLYSQTKQDIEKFGGTFADYLVHIKKTEEEMRNDLREPGEKRAKIQLMIFDIANKENIKPTAEEIDAETVKILTQYKDADEKNVRVYAEQVLINEKVLEFLGV